MIEPITSKLRPSKVRSAIGRRWFERSIGRTPVTGRGGPISLGTPYGGWIMPADAIRPGWICYSVGAGNDISFDLALIERFDVSIQSVEPDEHYVAEATRVADGNPRFSVYRAAVTVADGPIQMQRTHHPGSRSLSAARLYDTDSLVEIPGRSLASLARELGHTRIDILKIDIEGAEYDVLPTLDLDTLGVQVLATQLHHNRGTRAARMLIEHFLDAGFELVAMRPVLKLTFVRRELLDSQRGR